MTKKKCKYYKLRKKCAAGYVLVVCQTGACAIKTRNANKNCILYPKFKSVK